MKKTTSLLAIALITIFIGCGEPQKQRDTIATETATEADTKAEPTIDVEAVATAIDQKRNEIETSLGEPTIVPTDALKEKIKQKWQKIHFYTADDQVVRIKTYPYPTISTRTEEFYLENGKLILSVVEDNGEGDRGKSAGQLDKMYYFQDNEIVKEVRGERESEYSVKDGDAEELLAELKEYLDIYANSTKQ